MQRYVGFGDSKDVAGELWVNVIREASPSVQLVAEHQQFAVVPVMPQATRPG